jgi:flagellar protein FlaG
MYVQASTSDPAPGARSGGTAVRELGSGTAAAQVGAATAPAVNADKAEDPHAVRSAVAAINRAAKSLTNTVQLVMDERSEHPVVKVMDAETGQLIRQIPSEEVLELRRALDRISGLLINRTA